MKRAISRGIFYKLLNFADNSAIGFAFTEDYGKLKFFISRAFTKKGSIYKIIPGEIDFLKKENTDLNKFYHFKGDLSFYFFLEYMPLYLRLYLIFEVIDLLYNIEESDRYLYKLLLHANINNVYKFSLYTMYYIIKKTGINFKADKCIGCAQVLESTAYLTNSGIFCRNCVGSDYLRPLNEEELNFFKMLEEPSAFKFTTIEEKWELHILEILVEYIEIFTNKKIKSFENLKVMQ
jgi:DNA repair protein RecO (recombination protein O)